MSRPTSLTPALAGRICALVRAGHYVDAVCRAVGIGRHTYYDWRTRGEAGEEPYAAFLEALEQAEGEAEIDGLDALRASTNYRGFLVAATFLERRFRARWSRSAKIDATLAAAEGAGPVKIEISVKDDGKQKGKDAQPSTQHEPSAGRSPEPAP